MKHQAQPRHLSRGIDYLNDIGAKLRDLKGFNTLAHELIQNAEDSEGVTWMCFDIRDGALVVDNDGVFSDCGSVEEANCPWRPEKGHMCDFHRFRLVGSGDKREEEGKKGAFGIGFIAVYFSLSLFGRERHSEPETVPAHFQRQESRLYFMRGDGQLPYDIEEDLEFQVQRQKIDQVGMEKVLAYERKMGRTPKAMGPTHEGYDIESRSDGGEIERYIEVKSLSGDWDPMGVLLTKPQFEKARELGEKYWLYVVERAASDVFAIRRINDPARQANEFRYDDGWKALAEEEIDDQE